MSDNYLSFSEMIEDLTDDEKKWIESIPDRGDFEDNDEYEDEDAAMKAYAKALNDHGICANEMLADGNIDVFPMCSLEIQEENLWISTQGEEHGYPSHVAAVVQGFIKKFRPDYTFKLTWCEYCNKLRIGEFGGGWLLVDKDRIVYGNTWAAVDEEAKAQS